MYNHIVYGCLFTILIKELVIICCWKKFKEKAPMLMWVSIIANIITNVPLSFIFVNVIPNIDPLGYYMIIVLFELIIYVLEGFAYGFVLKKIKEGLLISLVLNVISFTLGSLIYNLLIIPLVH